MREHVATAPNIGKQTRKIQGQVNPAIYVCGEVPDSVGARFEKVDCMWIDFIENTPELFNYMYFTVH